MKLIRNSFLRNIALAGTLFAYACGPDNGNTDTGPKDADISQVDSDGDGLSDSLEAMIGTNPNLKDTDGDGFEDGFEYNNGYDPTDRNDNPNTRDGGVPDSGYDGGVQDSGNCDPLAIAGPDRTYQAGSFNCLNFADNFWDNSCGGTQGYGSKAQCGKNMVNYKVWEDHVNQPNNFEESQNGWHIFRWTQSGTYTVRLEVTDSNNITSTDEAIITIQ